MECYNIYRDMVRAQRDEFFKNASERFNDEEMALVKKGFSFAEMAHINQRRKAGEPYITHPLAVAKIVLVELKLGVNPTIAALLHDVVEDSDFTFEDLEAKEFGDDVMEAIRLMTHDKDVLYLDYVAKIKPNPIARAVKLADLRHNSDTTRLDTITEKDLERLGRYKQAIALLEE